MPDSNDMNLPIPAALPTPAPTPVARTSAPTKPPVPASKGTDGSIALEALVLAILLGLAAAGAVAAIRKKWQQGATGKFALWINCDLCVSFWTSAALNAAWWYGTGLPVALATVLFFGTTFLATVGVALLAVKAAGKLTDPFSGSVVGVEKVKRPGSGAPFA